MPDQQLKIEELFSLAGRVAAVIGGAGPLGSTISETLAACGADVLIVDLAAAEPTKLADRLTSDYQVKCDALEVDLLADGATDQASDWIAQRGQLDVLVHNAALTGASGTAGYAVPFTQQTDEAFVKALGLNLAVPFSLTRNLQPLLAAKQRGSVICVSSIYGLVGPNMNLYEGTEMGNPAAYAASKGGLAQLTKYLATVLAPDIRANAFAPGGISRGQPDAFLERYSKLTPLGRMATESDFAGVVAFLASDASRYVTGQVVGVDGGWTAW